MSSGEEKVVKKPSLKYENKLQSDSDEDDEFYTCEEVQLGPKI